MSIWQGNMRNEDTAQDFILEQQPQLTLLKGTKGSKPAKNNSKRCTESSAAESHHLRYKSDEDADIESDIRGGIRGLHLRGEEGVLVCRPVADLKCEESRTTFFDLLYSVSSYHSILEMERLLQNRKGDIIHFYSCATVGWSLLHILKLL